MAPYAILLNGTSSSGKSSLAGALQRSSREPLIHVSVDMFLNMVQWKHVDREVFAEAIVEELMEQFHQSLSTLTQGRFPFVIDHVWESSKWASATLKAVDSVRLYKVGLHCPLSVLEAREQVRGDRKVGLAKRQIDIVHLHGLYDLEIDTSKVSSESAAQLIWEYIQKKQND